jgi:ankyrin repeat protein
MIRLIEMVRLALNIVFMIFFVNVCVHSQEISDLSEEEQLIIAASNGDSVSVQILLRRGANINATYEGVNALMFASQNGYTDIVRILLKNGAKPNVRAVDGNTALMMSVLNGYIETAEYLIRNGADINLADNNRVTPLMHAIAVDSFYLPDMLLYYGADIVLKDNEGKNALMLACRLGHYEMAIKLLEAGADIHSTDNEGNTPLHYATTTGKTDVMELLLINGAKIDVKNTSGYTPLSIATARNNYSAAKILIANGADVNTRINRSLNPLTLAYSQKSDSLKYLLMNHEAEQLKRLYFSHFVFGPEITFNNDDSHIGVNFGLSESRYHFMPSMGYALRPKSVKVLDVQDSMTSYQYRETRHFITLNLDKAFFIRNFKSGISTAAFAGIGGSITFGSYKGSEKKPDTKLLFNPRIGCMAGNDIWRVKICYEYLDLGLKTYDTSWLSLSLEVLIGRKFENLGIP